MAKLYFEIEADYRKVIKLREEIEKLQRTMRTFGSHTSVDEIKELESKLKTLRGEYDSLTEKAAKSAVTLEKSSISFGKALAAVGGVASLKMLGSEIIRVRGEFQEMGTAIETLVGKRMSDKLLPQIKELAKVSPLTMTDIIGAEKMMLGFNIEADKTIGFLKALSDVSMGSSQKFNSLTLAFSQMSAAGKLMGQDLNQMINAGFNPLQQISLTTGKSIAVLKEEMSKGAISAEMVQKAFMDATSAGGKFYNMSENASKTINGQLSMMEDAWDSALNEMGQKTEGIIMSGIQATTSLIQNYETIGKVLLSLVGVYGVYKAALLTNIALEKVQAFQRLSSIKGISTMTMLTDILAKKTAALNLVTKASPWGMAAAGVTALAIGAYKLFTYQTDLEKATNKLNQEITKEQGNIDDLFGKLDAAKNNTEAYESAKQDIINQYGDYLKGLKDEVATLKDVEAAYLAISSAARLAAQERAIADANEKANSDYNTQKEGILGSISNLFQGNKRASSSVLAAIQRDFAQLGDGNISEQTRNEIKKYKSVGDEILRQISFIKAYRLERDKTFQGNRDNFDEWGVLSMSESELNKRIESVKTLRKQMEDSGKSQSLVTSSGKMVFNSLLEVDSYLSALEVRSAKITEGRKSEPQDEGDTYREAYKKAEKRWKDAIKAVNDAKNKSQKEYETAVEELETAEKDFKNLGGDTTGKGKKESDKEAEEALKRAEELLSIRRQNQQAEINLMKEGSEKRLAQLDFDFQNELDAIEKQEKEWKDAQKGKLTVEQSNVLSEWDEKAYAKYQEGVKKVNDDKAKAEKEAQQQLLIQFGNYQQQRQGIEQKYAEMKANTDVESEKILLNKQMEAELASIDEKFGYTTTAMADLFEDAANKSVNSIQKIIDKYEMLVAFKSGATQEDGTKVTKDELLEIGISEKDLESLEKGEISIKDITDALKALKGEMKEKSPWKTFTGDLTESINKLKVAKGDSTKIGEGLTGIGNAVTNFAPALKDFGANIGNIFGFDDAKLQSAIDGVAGLGQTAAGVGQIMSGDIVGGAMSAVSGISSVVTAFEGLFGADYSQYNKLVEEYNGLIDVWDKIIDRKREYISIDYGDEARKAGEESLNIINKQIEAYRNLGEERLNAGASIGSHSIGVRQRNAMSQEGWNELQAAAREVGFNYASVADGRMTGLFKLSAEQLDDLRSKAPTFWAKLDEDVRNYLEKIIEINDQLEETKNLLNEATTGISFDSFYDSFVSTLSDMDSESKDFADDFGEYLKTAILSNLIANKYKGKIQELYDQWANKSDSDGDGIYDLTSEEASQLKDAQKALAEQMIKERDAMAETFGWEDSYAQEASSKEFQGMNQETGDELKGRFTALQVAGEEVKAYVSIINMNTSELKNINAGIRDSLIGIQEQIAGSYLELVAINQNTGASAKYLKDIREDIAQVKENTKNL